MTNRAEFDTLVEVCHASPRFKEAVAEFSLVSSRHQRDGKCLSNIFYSTLTADGRQYHMPTPEIHFHGSKHSTLVMGVQEIAPTTYPLVVTASVSSRYAQIPAWGAKVANEG